MKKAILFVMGLVCVGLLTSKLMSDDHIYGVPNDNFGTPQTDKHYAVTVQTDATVGGSVITSTLTITAFASPSSTAVKCTTGTYVSD